jgi:hypothetical protein
MQEMKIQILLQVNQEHILLELQPVDPVVQLQVQL